jgi:2-polyprenyl-3-methyl-5-hydroxy-6-metoxy-1,4-benzoquinol methylase
MMTHSRLHDEKNQDNYHHNAATHNKLGLNSTLYLAYRDVPTLLHKYLFGKVKKTSFKVLDFGCGAGLSTELIANIIADAGYQAEIVGVDISGQNIKFASDRLPTGKFIEINPGQNLAHLGEFDLIICNFVLVETKEKLMTDILKSVQSLMKDSGITIVTNCASKSYKNTNKWYTFNNDFEENIPTVERGDKMAFKEDQPIKVQIFASYGSDIHFTFFDFYHSGEAYRKAYQAAGLGLLETHKPVGIDSDGIEWRDEKHRSPYKIHVLSKQTQPEIEMKHNKSLK